MKKTYTFDYVNFLTGKTERGNATAANTEELERLVSPHRIANLVGCAMPCED